MCVSVPMIQTRVKSHAIPYRLTLPAASDIPGEFRPQVSIIAASTETVMLYLRMWSKLLHYQVIRDQN